MKDDKKYDEAMARIRAMEPVLEDGGALTSGILTRIGGLKAVKACRIHRRLIIAGRVSAAAAAILIGLLTVEISVPKKIPAAWFASRADLSEYYKNYEGLRMDEAIGHISVRRQKSKAIVDAARLRLGKYHDNSTFIDNEHLDK